MFRSSVIVLATVLPIAAFAQSFQSINKLEVIPRGPTSLEVIESPSSGVRDVWCAAADYVRQRLGDPIRARLTLNKPHGPSRDRPGRDSVGFTITPDPAIKGTGPSIYATLDEIGTNLSVPGSYQYCEDVLYEIYER
jgi:hypothetical protein